MGRSPLLWIAPDFLYTEMLPSMAVSADVDNVQQMAEATAEVAAVLEAAKGRIKLFNIACKRDQKRMSDHLTSILGLRGLLQWKFLDHRRTQAKTGSDLVQQHMQEY